MEYTTLGHSTLRVSKTCLGTMTFGEQNSEADGHAQLDYALARGVNFIDTAEMYPVMPRAATYGRTEAIIGSWLARHRHRRGEIVLASKVVGPGRGFAWIRDGHQDFDRASVNAAVDASLRRLQTDYIDLYQLHWPNRHVPMFGNTRFDPQRDGPFVAIAEQLEALADLVKAGKIRYIGVSNETCWGVSEFVRQADRLGLPRIVSVQNPYNLMNRTFEQGLDEVCYRERVSLLAYSPLAFGRLSGKYADNPQVAARLNLFPPTWSPRYMKDGAREGEARYAALARRFGLSPAQMALAWCHSRWFVASTIIGATTLEQLTENLDAASLTLSDDVLAEIDAVHAALPNPAP